jgi:hypothetical protein
MRHPVRCEPARNSRVDSIGTGSTGIHIEQFMKPSTLKNADPDARGSPLLGSGLLHQHVIVIEPDLRRAHQRTGDVRGLGFHGHRRVFLDALPVAEVLHEGARIVLSTAGDLEHRSGLGEVALDPALDEGDLIRREGSGGRRQHPGCDARWRHRPRPPSAPCLAGPSSCLLDRSRRNTGLGASCAGTPRTAVALLAWGKGMMTSTAPSTTNTVLAA